MTEFTDASGNLPHEKPAPVPLEAAPDIDEFAVWPHGAVDPDPAKAEIQRKWLTVELFLLQHFDFNPLEAGVAASNKRSWPEDRNWLANVFLKPLQKKDAVAVLLFGPWSKKDEAERRKWRTFSAETMAKWRAFAAAYATTEHWKIEAEIWLEESHWDDFEPDWWDNCCAVYDCTRWPIPD